MDDELKVLVIEDAEADFLLVERHLRRHGLEVGFRRVGSLAELASALDENDIAAVLSDYSVPGMDFRETLALIKERIPDVPVILVSGSVGEEAAVDLLKLGVWDFVLKQSLARLGPALERSLREAADQRARRTAERALRESEERYRSLFEQAPIGIYRTTPDGRILLSNPALLSMLGYASMAELETRNLEDAGFQPQYPRDRFKEILERDGKLRGFETVWLTRDGQELVVRENAQAIRGADGQVLYYEGSVEDVTARRRAERAVDDERARFRTLSESVPFGMRLSDSAGSIVYLNPVWVELFGYPPEELPDLQSWWGLAYPDPAERERTEYEWRADLVPLGQGGTVMHLRTVTCRDGGQRLARFTSVRLGGGQILTTCEDITERARAEEAQRRLATAVDQTGEAVMVTDPDGAIQYVNPAFERITGYSRDEVMGLNPRLLKSGRHDAAFYAGLWATIAGGGIWSGHLINRRKDGALHEVDMTVSPVRDERGTIVNFVAVVRDVTREVALQQQLNQAQKMEAVGTLAGGIAHDFNNLLQAMLNQVSVLRQGLSRGADPAQPLAELDQFVRRGASLTRQLLLFSRQEEALPARLGLNEMVTSTSTMLRRLLRANVALRLELAEGELPVEADRGQLDQVLMNLAVNASDAMPEGGTLVIRTGSDLGRSVWFEVQDTGSGISDGVREHLFEPFFTTKGVGKGTGLGLSVVHGIVSQHRGRIEVASRVGEGTTFRVVLPRTFSGELKAIPETPPSSPELVAGHGERVLVVEDEAGARSGLEQILVALGFAVTAVASGEEAGRLPAIPAFDVLLTDLMLPGISGIELAHGLEQRWPALRVILMSGYTEDEAVHRGTVAGTVRFLQKPFDLDALATAIRRALDAPGPAGTG